MIKRRRMQVSTDEGKTWKYRWISPWQKNPNLSELKAGELVKVNGNEHIVIVTNGKLACPPLGLSLLADIGREEKGIPVEAIQRVMETLGSRLDDANALMKDTAYVTRQHGYGRKTELRNAIVLLEEAIAQYAPESQVRSQESHING